MRDEALSHNLRALDRQMSGFFTIGSERLSMERLALQTVPAQLRAMEIAMPDESLMS